MKNLVNERRVAAGGCVERRSIATTALLLLDRWRSDASADGGRGRLDLVESWRVPAPAETLAFRRASTSPNDERPASGGPLEVEAGSHPAHHRVRQV